jgi:hypothetical protein
VGEERVNIQSNNTVRSGFCVHSNSHVSLNQNDLFEPGTIMSMPDLEALDTTASGYEKNKGLELALRAGTMDIRMLRELDDIIVGLEGGDRDYLPDYITSTIPVPITHTKNKALDLTMGTCCRGGSTRSTAPRTRMRLNTAIHCNRGIFWNAGDRVTQSRAGGKGFVAQPDQWRTSLAAPAPLFLFCFCRASAR